MVQQGARESNTIGAIVGYLALIGILTVFALGVTFGALFVYYFVKM